MIKKAVAVFGFLLIIGGVVYYYMHLRKQEVPVSNAITAIPIDASFIFESKRTFPLWKNISQTNEIWKDLLGLPYFEDLNGKVKYLDSILSDNPQVSKILENQSLFVSAHPNGLKKFDYLFICAIPATSSQADLEAFVDSLGVKKSGDDVVYEQSVIHCLKKNDEPEFYFAISNGIFISSFKIALVKESLRQINSHISLLNNAYFRKVLNTSGGQPVASFYLNFQTFNNVSSHLGNKNFNDLMGGMQDFAQWMGLDVTINPDEVIMTGFTDCDTTGTQFISLFQHQSTREIKAATIAPSNTTFMMSFEYSDYARFVKDYKSYLVSKNDVKDRLDWLYNFEKKYDLKIEKYFYSWIGNEVSLVITEPSDSTFVNDTYVMVNTTDIQQAVKSLETIADSVAAKAKTKVFDSVYMQHHIHNMGLEDITTNLLGSSFSGVTKSWYAAVGNYIIFANSCNALKAFIYQFENSNTLEKDIYYKDYTRQYVESESGIYIYNNLALSSGFYSRFLDKSYSADMKKHKDVFSKLHAASIQFNFIQGMFYTNIYLKRNPLFKKEITPLWQIAVDTTLATPPCWVTDFITHGQYIIVEDKNNVIYYINNNGHIEWKKKIDGVIASPVYETDAFNNNKIQYLFNTAGYIHLIDRIGNEIGGFPIKLSSSASGPLNLVDFDNNKNYRMLIPCQDRMVREYDVSGRAVDGWVMLPTSEPIKCAAQYCNFDGKDYLLWVDKKGKVYSVDRKGYERLNLDNRLPPNIQNFYLQKGKDLAGTYLLAIDSTGTIFKLNLTGQLSTSEYTHSSCIHPDFVPALPDSSGKQEMFFLCENDLYAYNPDKTEKFHTSVNEELENNLLLFVYPNHELRIGAVDQKNQKIYLWDNTGTICPGFPVFGSGSFSIADMKNDGALYLVTGAGNKVYVYGLQ